MAERLEGTVLSGFELIELIGEGAHGSVWRARQTRLGRDVAVKILDPVVARNPDTVRRFEREGRAAASLDHPNVVPVYEAGEAGGLVFIAMRLVEGQTLEELIDARGPVSPEEAGRLLAPVAEALDHAHARDLVHRDVKPSNILIEGDRVWLADFGIAASLREMGSYTTGALGTAEYMAPEQASAGDVDHRADLYGLGCVAHCLMEGAPPYAGDDLVATLMAHVNEPVPVTGDVTRDEFYARALAKDPVDRFATAGELVAALGTPAATGGRGAGGAPAVEVGGDSKGPDRRLLIALAVAAVAVVALVGGVLAFGGGGDDGDTGDAIITPPVSGSVEDDAGRGAANGSASEGGEGGEGSDGGGEATTADEPVGAEDDGDSAPDPPDVELLQRGGNVEVGTTRLLTSANPHADMQAEPFITGLVLPPLMVVDSDWTLRPWLAAGEPTVLSEDPLVVRWELRDDAVWDDGSPVTATDVERTLQYIQDPTAAVGAATLHLGVEISVIDERTFDLTFPAPTGTHRILFSTFHPVIKASAYDQHLAEGNEPSTFLTDGVDFSAGPFRVSGWDEGQRLTLVRNENYWGDPPNLDRVTIRHFDSTSAQIDALENGDVDLIYVESTDSTSVGDANNIQGVVVETGVDSLWLRLDLNTRLGQTSEPAVRVAAATALDRKEVASLIVTPVTGEPAGPLDTLVWPGVHPANLDPFGVYSGDDGAARALLQEAGWDLTVDPQTDVEFRQRDGEVLEVTMLFSQNLGPMGQLIAQRVVFDLDEAQIRVQATPVDAATMADRRASGDYDIALVVDLQSPDPVAAEFRWSSEYCPVGFGVEGCTSDFGTNATGISDADLDQLLDEAGLETDPQRRQDLFNLIDRRLAELAPAIPLLQMPTFVAHRDELGGVTINTHRGGPFVAMAGWGYRTTSDEDGDS